MGGRRGVPQRAVAIGVVAAAIAAFVAPTGAGADPSPIVEGSVQHDNVAAHGFVPGTTLTFELFAADGVTPMSAPIPHTADPGGNTMFFAFEHGQNLVPDQVVQVSSGAATKRVTLVPLAITNIDPAENTVAGTATAGTTVDVDANAPPSGGAHLADVADGSGNWSVDFDDAGPPFDVTFASFVNARVFETGVDADGDATVSGIGPRIIAASALDENISAHGFDPGTAITFELLHADGVTPLTAPIVRTADLGGNAQLNGFEHGQNLLPGHVVRVSGGSVTKTLTLIDVAITAIDPTENTVSGTTLPSRPVTVDANIAPVGGAHLETTSSGGGTWSVDFDDAVPPFDLTFGSALGVRVAETGPDADGDATTARSGPSLINVSVEQDNVSVNGFVPGSTLTFELLQSDGTTPLTTPIVRIADAGGNAFLNAFEHGQNLLPGHVVRVSGGPVTKELTLVDLAVTSVDADENTVAGTTAAGTPITVDAHQPPGGQFAHLETTAGDGGAWSVDFDDGDPCLRPHVRVQREHPRPRDRPRRRRRRHGDRGPTSDGGGLPRGRQRRRLRVRRGHDGHVRAARRGRGDAPDRADRPHHRPHR